VKWLDRILGLEHPEREPARGDPQRIAEVERVLARIAPLLAADGGEVRLVAVEGDAVVLAWSGACRSCSAQAETLQRGIEPALRAELPWITGVRAAPM
jgi:Fe-S cluster biogenesis protein NfuA